MVDLNTKITINRIKIRYSKLYDKWQTISPDGRIMGEFSKLSNAKKSARETKDFVRR